MRKFWHRLGDEEKVFVASWPLGLAALFSAIVVRQDIFLTVIVLAWLLSVPAYILWQHRNDRNE